jgi:hypothetical protein
MGRARSMRAVSRAAVQTEAGQEDRETGRRGQQDGIQGIVPQKEPAGPEHLSPARHSWPFRRELRVSLYPSMRARMTGS